MRRPTLRYRWLPKRRALQALRQLHRWAAVFLVIFMILIGASGTVLQVIMTIYGDTGPRQAPGEPFWVAQLRDLAVTLHTIAFAGMAGVYISAICAVGLLFFAISGLLFLLDQHRTRVAQGRSGLFWLARAGKGATMRSLHRWITPPIVAFAVLLAVTAASLDAYFAWFDMVPLPPPRRPPAEGRAPPLDPGVASTPGLPTDRRPGPSAPDRSDRIPGPPQPGKL